MKKVLFVNEFSLFSTGYSTYGKEVLSRLYETGKYELAEFASYIKPNDKRIGLVPWKVYGNEHCTQEEEKHFNSVPLAEFGAWKFEQVVLDFKPDVILSIRDNWMDSFIANSPFRHCYSWIYMPTVDAEPQMEDWLDTINKADRVFTYNDWSLGVLKNSGVSNLVGAAPPCASNEYKPIEDAKNKFGLKEVKIVGTVMRNQRRKLYPNLFKGFRRYLDKSGRADVYLYCHTSYPDAGWDIPYWLKYFDITSRTLFTYICRECLYVYPSLFSDVHGKCQRCGGTSVLPNVKNGISDNVLALVYNVFDVYVQYANSEGFGMPQVEAAACGVPIMSVDYSAMHDVITKLGGYPIKVLDYHIEPESGCKRAIPDDEYFADMLVKFFSLSPAEIAGKKKAIRQAFEREYTSWDVTAKLWEEQIDGLPPGRWNSPSRYHRPSQDIPQCGNSDYVRWLLKDVLGEPELINSYMGTRLLRDLNVGFTSWGPTGYFFNENALNLGKPRLEEFNRDKALKHILGILEKKNFWEEHRCQK